MSRLHRGIYVFYQYGDGTGNLVYSFFDGGSWQTVNELVPNTLTCGPPAAAFYIDSYNNEKIYCPHQGADDEGNGTTEFWYNVFDGTGWSGDAQRSNTLLTYHPSAV